MTSSERAIHLVSHLHLVHGYGDEAAKIYALTKVKNVIQAIEPCCAQEEIEPLKYWLEVEQEIKKL